jgi:single-strand DNA-binding protein
MPKSVNKVTLLGNLGQDPDIRYTPNGTALAKFSVATNERFKDKSGEWQDRVEWHNVVAWQRLAEIVGEYVKKGSKVYIEGRLQTSSWQDRNSSETKYRTEVVARDLVLLGNGNGNSGQHAEEAVPQRKDRRGSQLEETEEPDLQYASQISDDDIPF